MTQRVTERDILHAMIDGTIAPDVMAAYAEKKLAQLDKRNATAKVRAAKKRAEGDELTEAVLSVRSDEPMSRDDVLEELKAQYPDLTIGKVSYRLVKLSKTEDGRAVKQEAIIAGEEGTKTRRIAVYTRA